MIKLIEIQNYKSIENLTLDLGRVNVFIGENGAGKSNILEGIALAGSACAGKLDNEFLVSRGVRVTKPTFMRAAFPGKIDTSVIEVHATGYDGDTVDFMITNTNEPYAKWECAPIYKSRLSTAQINKLLENYASSMDNNLEKVSERMQTFFGGLATHSAALSMKISSLEQAMKNVKDELSPEVLAVVESRIEKTPPKKGAKTKTKSGQGLPVNTDFGKFLISRSGHTVDASTYLESFIIYSPENSSLRAFQREGQIEPLGVNGEGVLKLLHVMSTDEQKSLASVKKSLRLLGWFDNFNLKKDSEDPIGRIEIKDRYLDAKTSYFDQLSANEGFLFLTFYFALFASNLTPKFFAIDNIDASLNPKLCEGLITTLVPMAKAADKQVILTTHNPAILDGLNLDDDEQRLFVVSRNRAGQTRVKRILKPRNAPDERPIRLSEAFLRGTLGGLPKSF